GPMVPLREYWPLLLVPPPPLTLYQAMEYWPQAANKADVAKRRTRARLKWFVVPGATVNLARGASGARLDSKLERMVRVFIGMCLSNLVERVYLRFGLRFYSFVIWAFILSVRCFAENGITWAK